MTTNKDEALTDEQIEQECPECGALCLVDDGNYVAIESIPVRAPAPEAHADAAPQEPVAYTSPDRLARIAKNSAHVDTMWGKALTNEGENVALYAAPVPSQATSASAISGSEKPISDAALKRFGQSMRRDGYVDAMHEFKHFHRTLCERVGYVHDDRGWQRDQLSLIEWIAAAIPNATSASSVASGAAVQEPVAMILHCPKCGTQHIDASDERTEGWSNPPHRSHLCHECGTIWRPADIATVGVAEIATKGSADNYVDASSRKSEAATLTDEIVYQRRKAGLLAWHDCSHEEYLEVKERISWNARTLYAAPVPRQAEAATSASALARDEASVHEGWKLAMRVLQSDLYRELDDAERAECDALVRKSPYIAASSAATVSDAASVRRDERAALNELSNIADAKRFDHEIFADDTEFADWVQSRARHTLRAASSATAALTSDSDAVRIRLAALKDAENIARLFDLGTPDGHAIADSIRKLAESDRAQSTNGEQS